MARATLRQCMLRVKDPAVSVPFYEKHFGMKLVHRYDTGEPGMSHYFLERPNGAQVLPSDVPSPASKEYFQSSDSCALQLTHVHGTESDPEFKGYWSGNHGRDAPESSPLYLKDGPIRGFGHFAFNVDDVYKTSEELEAAGVKFQKRPDEGRMKGLSFCLDPDGYWIELVRRDAGLFEDWNFSQVMMRAKDGPKCVEFYCQLLGMTMVEEYIVPNDFTNYMLMCITDEEKAIHPPESYAKLPKILFRPALEITYNHGTEKDDTFEVHNGNSDPLGFGHIGFLVDDLQAIVKELDTRGVPFLERPEGDSFEEVCILDPSGYHVKLYQRLKASA